ncbi:hypothetical protein JCM5350_006388 [Sporobolomyces pararoseus]
MPSNLPVPPTLDLIKLRADSTSSSKPRRKIFTAADLEPWFASRAYTDLETYILQLCHAITRTTVIFLKEAEGWIDGIPLQTTPQRFGNKAFRDWLDKLKQRNDDFQKALLATSSDVTPSSILPELSFNFLASFGSGPRLDYGTGHELSFLLWLLSLRLIGILSPQDDQAVVLRIFTAYLDLVRKVQKVFKLEPAGSKGVWGLDDHQHLSYLFGASQLIDNTSLRPSSILQPRTLSPLAQSYLLPASILHIHALKSGPFSEHSPLLHQIASTVPNWTKVQQGLWKMYKEEVLAKVPVVQHLRFGSLIRWTSRDTEEVLPSTGDGREEADEHDESEQDQDQDHLGSMRAPQLSGLSSHHLLSQSTKTPLSQAAARRTPYTVSTTASTSRPTNFAPPTLFPPRDPQIRSANSIAQSSQRRTLAEEGGAAAQSSPFGILASATAGGRTEVQIGRRPEATVSQPVITKAPWAT